MAIVRISDALWMKARAHLTARAERFGFFFAETAETTAGPLFLVRRFVPVADAKVSHQKGGYEIDLDTLLAIVNEAARSKQALVEAHSHGGSMPRFSTYVDRPGLEEFVPYVLESLPGRPYAATVWGDDSVYGEFFDASGARGPLRSVLVTGRQIRQLISRDDDDAPTPARFDRQLLWFRAAGQRMLGRLQIGVVGCGGTGSHVVQQLAYLGVRDFVLVEFDPVDDTNLNRVVTAAAADAETPKGILARRLIRAVASDARVRLISQPLQSEAAIDALKTVDLLIGCVDNDGARLVLNELSLAYEVPYLDIATGIDPPDGTAIEHIGGRLVVVHPDAPCLHCHDELDLAEARYYNAAPDQRAVARARGYAPVKAPSVVSLNALLAAALVNELAVWVSGIRELALFTDFELFDPTRSAAGQWLTPRTGLRRKSGCIECALRGTRDGAALERYWQKAST